jgi:hypothetical protein
VSAEKAAQSLAMVCINSIKGMRAQWSKLTEAEQEMYLESLRSAASQCVEEICRTVAANNFPAVLGSVQQITVTDGSVKVSYKVETHAKHLHKLVDHGGKQAVLVLVDPEGMNEGLYDIKPDPDQKPLLEDKQ